MNVCTRVLLALAILAAGLAIPAAADETLPVGVARVDITPDYPVRLTGYAVRSSESEGVAEHLWAKALAIGGDEGDGPAVLMMVENCGVPASLRAEVAGRLKAKAGVKPERLVVCSTHTHAGPWLMEFAPAMWDEPLPAQQRAHLERYRGELAQHMEQTALAALKARRPGRLAWAEGKVHFAMNRRPAGKGSRVRGLGVNPTGPVDESLPLLCAFDAKGKLLATVVNYACHGTTLGGDFNRIHGDWAGLAQEYIEAEHPGVTALVCLGCAGDANPEPRGKAEMVPPHGRAVAAEVGRLLRAKLTPLSAKLAARRAEFQLPYDNPPTRQQLQERLATARKPNANGLEKRIGIPAAALLAGLERGRPLPAGVDYSVTVWSFGKDLSMIFLPGEVVVDFDLRLKRELAGTRLWISAYSNDVPCYIVSRRVLAEGGYEPNESMIYYGRPSPLSPFCEDRIVSEAVQLVKACSAAAKR